MDFDFWDNCWQRDSQPFHVEETHELLVRNYQQFFSPKESILVPLSGKSVDPLFLAKQGFNSVAVEFNPTAVEAFFSENKLTPIIYQHKNATQFQLNKIDIWLADFFDLTAHELGHFSQVFDRAALVALPKELRSRYVVHLQSLLSPKARILMVTMDYNESQMAGPPFYLSPQELQSYFPDAKIVEIDRQSLMDNHSRWQELELDYLDEVLYSIQLS